MNIRVALTIPLQSDGVSTSFDIDLTALPDGVWGSLGKPEGTAAGVLSAYFTAPSNFVFASASSISGRRTLHLEVASALSSSLEWTANIQLLFPL